MALSDVADRGYSRADLSLPAMTLRESALAHNLALMSRYTEANGVDLAPHGKTTMAPQLWDRQLRAGAWGLSAATVQQAQRDARRGRPAGDDRQRTHRPRGSIGWVGDRLADPAVELLSWVDSAEAVELAGSGPFGSRGGRAPPGAGGVGAPRGSDRVPVGRGCGPDRDRCRRLPILEVVGVAGYEGTLCAERTPGCLAAVGRYLDDLRTLAARVLELGCIPDQRELLVSAGGSAFFDVVVDRLSRERPSHPGGVRVILRSGCSLIHDHGFYAERSPFADAADPALRFEPAIELWASVLSLPEPELAIVGFGRRDAPFDLGLPTPLTVHGSTGAPRDAGNLTVERLNDQHAFCLGDGPGLAVGEVVRSGISHPCTAFDRWRIVPVLDDDDIVVDAVATFF